MTSVWLAATLSLLVTQAPPKSIVSPTWRTVQVKAELADFYADLVAKKLREHGYTVVTSNEIQELVKAQGQKELLGCADDGTNCFAELANALGCDATLLVNLARLDDTFRGNLKIISSVNGKVLSETQVEASGEKALAAELEAAAERLAVGLTPQKAAASSRRLWPVPAIGGAVLLAAGLACFAVSESTYSALDATLRGGKPISEGDARTGSLVQTLGWVGLGVGVAALVTAGVLWLVFDMAPTAAFAPGGSGLRWVFP